MYIRGIVPEEPTRRHTAPERIETKRKKEEEENREKKEKFFSIVQEEKAGV